MPPGHTSSKPPSKVVERATARAAIDIAHRVEHARLLAGDDAGSEAARQVAAFIEAELLAS